MSQHHPSIVQSYLETIGHDFATVPHNKHVRCEHQTCCNRRFKINQSENRATSADGNGSDGYGMALFLENRFFTWVFANCILDC